VPQLLDRRIRQAVQLRADLGLPSADTTVYRLINSEGDRLSGLIVDVLGSHVVAVASAAWVELHREAITAALVRETGLTAVSWRSDASMMKLEGLEPAEAPATAPAEAVVVSEGGVKYLADPGGQKTGFYADQRDNRAFLRRCAAGKRVLDLCCYSGGFALNAALAGASEVIGVDSSAAAIGLARQNADLNGVSDR